MFLLKIIWYVKIIKHCFFVNSHVFFLIKFNIMIRMHICYLPMTSCYKTNILIKNITKYYYKFIFRLASSSFTKLTDGHCIPILVFQLIQFVYILNALTFSKILMGQFFKYFFFILILPTFCVIYTKNLIS